VKEKEKLGEKMTTISSGSFKGKKGISKPTGRKGPLASRKTLKMEMGLPFTTELREKIWADLKSKEGGQLENGRKEV